MQISTIELKIKRTKEISTLFIENELKKLSVNPLRWAIVAVDEEYLTLDVTTILNF